MDKNYDVLKLDNQLCFPLYAAARETVKHYRPFLEDLDITYTQYITLMVLWEEGAVTVKYLGDRLYLDSGTLTPLLKSMEAKGLISRRRLKEDERCLLVSPTEDGEKLKERAAEIPFKVAKCLSLSKEEALTLFLLLKKVLKNGTDEETATL